MRAGTEIENRRLEIEGSAAAIVDRVLAVATGIAVSPPAQLAKTRASLRTEASGPLSDDLFKIVVCGRFRNGKSTFVNALLGRATASIDLPDGELGPMPTADGIPTTATITQVRFAEEPYVVARRFDETTEEWSFQRYLREARLWTDAEDNSHAFEDIMMFEVGYPAELLRSGVTLVDSPGMDEDPRRTETTRQILREADAAIVVYRSDAFLGESERTFAAEVVSQSGKVFAVVNRFHDRPLDRPFRAMAAQRLGYDEERRRRFIEDPASLDVFGVNVLTALEASVGGCAERLASSGMADFEARISQFLLDDRYSTQAMRILNGIDQDFALVEQSITQRITVLGVERDKLDAVLADCDRKLDKIQSRIKKVGNAVERFGNEVERTTQDSFRDLVVELGEQLPAAFAEAPIPSLRNIGDKIQALVQKKFVEDAIEVLNGIVLQRLRDWGTAPETAAGLARKLAPILARLRDEITAEVRLMDEDLAAIRLQIEDLDPEVKAQATSVVNIYGRLVWAGLGLVTGNPVALLGATTVGWRGFAGGFSGSVGVGLLAHLAVLALGTTLAPYTLIGLVCAGWVFGGGAGAVLGVESRVRQQALAVYQPKLRALRDDPATGKAISEQVRKAFAELGTGIAEMVEDVVADERRNIEELRATKNFDHERKSAMLSKLGPGLADTRCCRDELRELRAIVRQTV